VASWGAEDIQVAEFLRDTGEFGGLEGDEGVYGDREGPSSWRKQPDDRQGRREDDSDSCSGHDAHSYVPCDGTAANPGGRDDPRRLALEVLVPDVGMYQRLGGCSSWWQRGRRLLDRQGWRW
jgi:hypothetical protein